MSLLADVRPFHAEWHRNISTLETGRATYDRDCDADQLVAGQWFGAGTRHSIPLRELVSSRHLALIHPHLEYHKQRVNTHTHTHTHTGEIYIYIYIYSYLPSTWKTNGGEKADERRLWGRARSEAHLRVYDFKGSERNQWDFGLLAIAALKKLSSSCIKKTVVPLVLDFIGDTNDSTMR